MEYPEIDVFMKQTSLAAEPAFDFLHFLIEDIPSPETRRILGLYYPEGEEGTQGFGYLPPSTIVLPPNASKYTLLHELGHRYNDFYFSDLSEKAADAYAQAFMSLLEEVSMNPVQRNTITIAATRVIDQNSVALVATDFTFKARVTCRHPDTGRLYSPAGSEVTAQLWRNHWFVLPDELLVTVPVPVGGLVTIGTFRVTDRDAPFFIRIRHIATNSIADKRIMCHADGSWQFGW